MNKDIQVGIVVPTFNQGKFIEATILSIIENMKHVTIKLVVIDGGSTDNSINIIKKYEKFIHYWVSEKDNGQSHAINKGMHYLADCEYVTWLNSDDVYLNEYGIHDMLRALQNTSCDVCYGKAKLIDINGKEMQDYPTEEFDREKLKYGCFISQPSTLIRKKAWDQVGGINEGLFMCMDFELWVKLSQTYTFVYIQSEVAGTRIYQETKTSKYKILHVNEAIQIIDKYFGIVPKVWILEKMYLGHNNRNISTKVIVNIKYIIYKILRGKIV
jgi:glycosyltransferase involved in cell wall biosynthesis